MQIAAAETDAFVGSGNPSIDMVVVMITEVIVRIAYSLKRIKEGNRIRDSIPFSLNRDKHPNLRHTFCTRIIENGMNIKSVQVLMGHAHAETTLRVYASITESRNQDEMKKMNGKFKIK